LRKELEYAKKITMLRKLVRAGLITENEYRKVKGRLREIAFQAGSSENRLRIA